MQVSGTDINRIVEKMIEHSVHGKLTGAGGEGGCVIGFYIPQSKENQTLEQLVRELKDMGYGVEDEIEINP